MSLSQQQLKARVEEFWRILRAAQPDGRLASDDRRQRTQVFIRGEWKERVYCSGCGRASALITPGSPHVYYLCGAERNNCAAKYGAPPGMVEIPEDLLR